MSKAFRLSLMAGALLCAAMPAWGQSAAEGKGKETVDALLDHPAVRNRIVNEGWQRCMQARPANLFTKDAAELVTLGNLEDNIDWVGEADWIVEAIVERLDVKQQLMARIEKARVKSFG